MVLLVFRINYKVMALRLLVMPMKHWAQKYRFKEITTELSEILAQYWAQ